MPRRLFFKNAPRKRRRKVTRRRKKLHGAAALAKRGVLMGAAAKASKKGKKRKKSRTAKKRTKRAAAKRTGTIKSVRRGGKSVSRRAWRASGYRRNPMARGRKRKGARRYRRRNPPLLGRGLVGRATQVLIGGAGVTAGKVVARQGITLLKQDPSTPIGIGTQLLVALVAGMLARQFGIKGVFADALVYGAAGGAAESTLRLVAPEQATKLLDAGGLSAWPSDGGSLGLMAYPTGAIPDREQSYLMSAYASGIM